MTADAQKNSVETEESSTALQDLEEQIRVDHERSTKAYLMRLCDEQWASKAEKERIGEIANDITKVNAPSFFLAVNKPGFVSNHDRKTDTNYVPKRKKLDQPELIRLNRLTAARTKKSQTELEKQVWSYLEGVYGNATFVNRKQDAEWGKMGPYLDRMNTQRATVKEKVTPPQSTAFFLLLLADTDYDGKIESLSQRDTTRKGNRRRLRETQKLEGRGVLSEKWLNELIDKARVTIETNKKIDDTSPAEDILAKNLASYFAKMDRYAHVRDSLKWVTTMKWFVDLLLTQPVLLWGLRIQAHSTPTDLMRIMEYGAGEWFTDLITTRDASEKKNKEDQIKIDEYLKSEANKAEVEKQQSVLKEKLDEHRKSIEEKIIKLNSLTSEKIEANWGVEAVRREIRWLVELIQQLKTVPDADLRRMCIDLMSAGGVVSLIPEMTGVWAGASFRFYEGKATDLINSAGFQIAWFQQIGWSKATAFGLSLVAGWTLVNSKKNTLFYSLQAGVGVQLVQKMIGHGFAFGAMIGDEMRVNEKKMKSLRPSQKLMVGALAGAGYALGVPKPRSVSAGIYLRRDKLGALAEQEGEIYLLVQDIMSKAKSTDRASLKTLIENYCKDQKIKKQRSEDIDRIAEVLHRAFLPYQTNLTAFQTDATKNKQTPERMGAVAEEIARDRFNRKTDDVAKVAITGVGVGASANFLGIYPSVGIQVGIREESIYVTDEKSKQRNEDLINSSEYDQKLQGSFADQLGTLNNKLIPTDSSKAPITNINRTVDKLGDYPFVILPDHLLDNPKVSVLIAPALQNATTGVHFKRNVANDGWEIPATVPVKFVETIVGNQKKVTLIIGGHNATNAIPLTKDLTPAIDDAWLIKYQQEKNNKPENKEKVETQHRETMYNFLTEKVKKDERNLPFDLAWAESIKTTKDLTTGRITEYLLPLKDKDQIASLGEKPTYQTKTESWTTYLVVPVGKTIQIVHSAQPADLAKPRRLEMISGTEGKTTFQYSDYPEGFVGVIEVKSEIDLLTNVDPELRKFLGSTAGTQMLMKRRYDDVNKKEEYYTAIQTDLKNPEQDYATSFALAKANILSSSANEKVRNLFNVNPEDPEAFRANLYLLYGALSRVRMTEYKHLTDLFEKKDILNKLLDNQIIVNKWLSEWEKQTLYRILELWKVEDEKALFSILQKLDSRFTWRGDTKYYTGEFPDYAKGDPIYQLIFLFAPIAKIYETRNTATQKVVTWEFGSDQQTAAAVMQAYKDLGNKIQWENPKELFLNKTPMPNETGLVFWYGSGATKTIDEKFVHHPEAMGPVIDLASEAGTEKIQDYYLDRYIKNNLHDVKKEIFSLGNSLELALKAHDVNLTSDEVNTYMNDFMKALMLNKNFDEIKTSADVAVNTDNYKQLMKTGKLNWVDRWNNKVEWKPTWKTAIFGDCVNFMITKWLPSIVIDLPKKMSPFTWTDAVVPPSPPLDPGTVVTAQAVVSNRASRRETTISAGVVAKASTKQEQAVSTTTPIELTPEQEALINIEGEQSSVMVPLGDGGTQVQVDAFAWSFDGKPGVYYIDNATGNRQFREGTVQNPSLGWPWVFTPTGSWGPLTDLSFLNNPRNYEMINQALQRQIVSAERQGTDGRKYVKQLKALE
jgi:hypothetical protein